MVFMGRNILNRENHMARAERGDSLPPPPQYSDYGKEVDRVQEGTEQGKAASKVQPGLAFGRKFTILSPKQMLRVAIEKFHSFEAAIRGHLDSILEKFPGRTRPIEQRAHTMPGAANAALQPAHSEPSSAADVGTLAVEWLAEKVSAQPPVSPAVLAILSTAQSILNDLSQLKASQNTPKPSGEPPPAETPAETEVQSQERAEEEPSLTPDALEAMSQAIKAPDTSLTKLKEISAQLEKAPLTAEQIKMRDACTERIVFEKYKQIIPLQGSFARLNHVYSSIFDHPNLGEEFKTELLSMVMKKEKEVFIRELNDPRTTLVLLKRTRYQLEKQGGVLDPDKTLTKLCNARIEYIELKDKIAAAKTEAELSALEDAVLDSDSSLILEQKFHEKDLVVLFSEKRSKLKQAN